MMKIAAQTTGESMATHIAGTFQPGARGSLQCWCQGQLLVMLGHYGWLLPVDDINHPALEKTDGKIYLHKRDIVGGAQLAEGDMVGFYLYVDDQGLGAEGARVLENGGKTSFNAEAAEFVPPPPGLSSWPLNATPHGMSADANEFVPAHPIMQTSAAEVGPSSTKADMPLWYKKESSSHKGKFYYVNSKTGKTSWKLPEDYVEPTVPSARAVSPGKMECMHSVSAINVACLSDDSSNDDSTDHEDTGYLLTGKQARLRCFSPTASTSAGLSSDDEIEEFPEVCLGEAKFRPPPGLTLPSSPSQMALGICARAGLSVEPEKQHEQQQKKLPPWRSTSTSKLISSVSESFAWTPPWRREAGRLVAVA